MVKFHKKTPTTWFEAAWGLCACGQHEVTFLHRMWVSVSAEQLQGVRQIFMYNCVCVHVLSHVQLCNTWTVAHQAPLPMGIL